MSSQAASQGANVVKATATGIISASPCRLVGVLVRNGAAARSNAVLNDNASAASGTEIGTFPVNSATSGDAAYFPFGEEGINCSNGIYATLTASTTAYFYLRD